MDTWDKEQTKMLLLLLKQCPCLYDPKDPNFTNPIKRNEKYNLILNEMKDFRLNITVQCIKNKIRTLQSQLSKERARALTARQSGIPYRSKLWCYNELQFLINCSETTLRNFNNNIPTHDIHNSMESTIDDEEKQEVTSIEQNTELSKQLQNQAIETLTIVKNLAEQRQKPEPIGKEEVFCKYLCSELRKIALEDTFDDLKIEILQLVRQTIKEEKNSLREQQQCLYKMGEANRWHLPPSR